MTKRLLLNHILFKVAKVLSHVMCSKLSQVALCEVNLKSDDRGCLLVLCFDINYIWIFLSDLLSILNHKI